MRHRIGKLLRPLLAAVLIAAGTLNLSPVFAADDIGTRYIVKYKECAAWLCGGAPFDVVEEEALRRLLDAELLQWYEPDGVTELLWDSETAFYAEDKWDLELINATGAFRQGWLGQGVRVAVIDSGVNSTGFLDGRLLPGHCYIDGASATNTADNYGHGTLVAGLIAGSGADGYVGAAPEAEIVPLKVTDGKSVTVSAVCRAIYGAIDDYDCDVLNLSLGFNTEYEALREAVEYAGEKGVVVVSAVGNKGNSALLYPASYDSVIGVGALDKSGTVYSKSNHNDSVFISAPGQNVKTTAHRAGYIGASGTSFAAPFASAAAAVMLSMNDSLTPTEIANIIAETASDRGDEGWDEYYGHGILDLGACADAVEVKPDTPFGFTSGSRLKNFTTADVDCTYILARYGASGRLLGMTCRQLTVPAGEAVDIDMPKEGTRYGQFVYETATMTPLAAARKSL